MISEKAVSDETAFFYGIEGVWEMLSGAGSTRKGVTIGGTHMSDCYALSGLFSYRYQSGAGFL